MRSFLRYYPRGLANHCKQICWENSLLKAGLVTTLRSAVESNLDPPVYCSGFDFSDATHSCLFYSSALGGGFVRALGRERVGLSTSDRFLISQSDQSRAGLPQSMSQCV